MSWTQKDIIETEKAWIKTEEDYEVERKRFDALSKAEQDKERLLMCLDSLSTTIEAIREIVTGNVPDEK